jgi:AcrR family transcriptional regulator
MLPRSCTGVNLAAVSRAERIESQAAKLFAERGFGATTIDDIGAAAGVSGPAIYWHFKNKQALLAEMRIDISERLLAGGEACVAAAADDTDALERLIAAQVSFALAEPDLIVVHTRELHHLEPEPRRSVRSLQRRYLAVWIDVVARLAPDTARPTLEAAVQAIIGLINSTPYLVRTDRALLGDLLERMAAGAFAAITADARVP